MTENGETVATESMPAGTPADRAAAPVIEDRPAPRKARLGEELPVFCERCGYSLHGLVQIRCETCNVLHFSCPECGHHQPINTLRPAFQRLLGRLRGQGLAAILFLKINYFFWPLFAWGALGTEISYQYRFVSGAGGGAAQYGPAPFEEEGGVIIFLFAFAFAAIARMLLLRWRHGVLVGLALGALVAMALIGGAIFRQITSYQPMPSPLSPGFMGYVASGFFGGWIGGLCAWGIWFALAHAFLPKRVAVALLDWQRGMSDPKRDADREPRIAVTA